MTFEQAFLKVKEKFQNADASKVADFAIQITMSDEDCGGTFYAEVKNGVLSVEPYDYYDNNLVLDITRSALLSILGGKLSLDKAIANGDASVKGDASKVADLKATIKKAPAKKAPAKKTAPKKEVAKKETVKKETVKKETVKKTVKNTANTEAKPVAKTEAKPVAKTEAKPVAKTEAKPAAKTEAKPAAKTTTTKTATKNTTK